MIVNDRVKDQPPSVEEPVEKEWAGAFDSLGDDDDDEENTDSPFKKRGTRLLKAKGGSKKKKGGAAGNQIKIN